MIPLWIWVLIVAVFCLVIALVILAFLCCQTTIASGSGLGYLAKTDLRKALDKVSYSGSYNSSDLNTPLLNGQQRGSYYRKGGHYTSGTLVPNSSINSSGDSGR